MGGLVGEKDPSNTISSSSSSSSLEVLFAPTLLDFLTLGSFPLVNFLYPYWFLVLQDYWIHMYRHSLTLPV